MMGGEAVKGLALAALLVLAACSNNGPYLDVSGGNFMFNYRLSEAYAGLIAAPLRALPEHARIEQPSRTPPADRRS